MKAVFFDRDGTLIIDKHYLSDPGQVEYYDDTFSALKDIQGKGFALFLITNQSGIGRGMFQEKDMHAVHHKMLEDFEKASIKITDIRFCPHSPEDQCECRKPKPQMINSLCEKYNIDKRNSHMIGDKSIDAQCGVNAGISGWMIYKESDQYKSFKNLTEFAQSL
jgi:D-glycero-D-manno-heptose 1,7-bisphosphate phosphatase